MIELDRDIIQNAVKGDRRAFRALYDFYAPFIWRVIFRSVSGDAELAAEIVQDTFIRVHRSLRKFRFDSSMSTWIYRIAYNCSMACFSRNAKVRSTFTPLNENIVSHEGASGYESRELVTMALEGLSADDLFLLTTREVDGLSFEELAEIMKMKPGALRTRLHRLKETIREKLNDKIIFSEDIYDDTESVLPGTGTDS